MKKRETVVTALIGFLFLLTVSVVLVLNMRWIYYYDIKAQNLVEETGYSEKTIRDNYDILIDYNLIAKGKDTLEFPDFPMSEQGRIHFKEVKVIFILVQYVCIVSGFLYAIFLSNQLRDRQYDSLKLTAILSLAVPAVIGTAVALWWDKVFILFHKIAFRNDYWLFDPAADPIIFILPDAFFFHCAVAIVGMILLGSIGCLTAYFVLRGKEKRKDNV